MIMAEGNIVIGNAAKSPAQAGPTALAEEVAAKTTVAAKTALTRRALMPVADLLSMRTFSTPRNKKINSKMEAAGRRAAVNGLTRTRLRSTAAGKNPASPPMVEITTRDTLPRSLERRENL